MLALVDSTYDGETSLNFVKRATLVAVFARFFDVSIFAVLYLTSGHEASILKFYNFGNFGIFPFLMGVMKAFLGEESSWLTSVLNS